MTSPGVSRIRNLFKTSKGFDTVLHNIKIVSVGDGNCLGELKVLPEQADVFNGMHGGFAATVIEAMSSCGLLTHQSGNCPHISINFNIDFIKGATVGDTILVDTKTLKVGKNLAFLEVEIKDKLTGDLLIKASHTKSLLPDKKFE